MDWHVNHPHRERLARIQTREFREEVKEETMAIDYMKVWRDMPLKTLFTIDGELFMKNSANTALNVSNPVFGERYIYEAQAKRIKPYAPPAAAPPVQVPKDPEEFETRESERKAPDPNFGATTVKVTPADTATVAQGIQPPPETGKRRKKASKHPDRDVPASEDFGAPHLDETPPAREGEEN